MWETYNEKARRALLSDAPGLPASWPQYRGFRLRFARIPTLDAETQRYDRHR
jgi:hypothetical protein